MGAWEEIAPVPWNGVRLLGQTVQRLWSDSANKVDVFHTKMHCLWNE